jgi:hypothetical protein
LTLSPVDKLYQILLGASTHEDNSQPLIDM